MARAFTLGLLLVLVSGCPSKTDGIDAGVVDAGPQALTEREPNDRADQALAVTGSSVVTASLSADPAKPDEDWLLLTSDRPQTVDLSVTGMPGVDVMLEVMDTDRNRLAMVNSGGEGKPERLPNLALRDKAYVRVTSAKRGTGGAYTLTALFQEPTEGLEAEPNDRAVDATLVPFGQSVSGFVGHPGDEDWFRIELAANAASELAPSEPVDAFDAGAALAEEPYDAGAVAEAVPAEPPKIPLKLELTGVPGVRFELSVLSVAEAPLFTVKGKDGEPLSLRNVGVRETDKLVYVVVKSAWSGTGKDAKRGFNIDETYTLTVGPEEGGATKEYEPNDELSKATPLAANGSREGFLSPKDDVDYYVLRTSEPVLADVQLSGVERVDLSLSVVQPPDGGTGPERTLLKSNDGALKEPEQLNNVSCLGECYFRVEGALRKVDGKWVRDYENPEQAYRIQVSTTPDNGSEEREPNHSVETATPIAFSRAMRGTVHPKKDIDYFRLDLSGKPVKTAIKATLLGVLKVDVGLYLHRIEEDGSLSLVQTADRAKADAAEVIRYAAEPGVYLLEVRDAKNRESNFQDAYQLTVEEGE